MKKRLIDILTPLAQKIIDLQVKMDRAIQLEKEKAIPFSSKGGGNYIPKNKP